MYYDFFVSKKQSKQVIDIPEPQISKFLFADTRMGWFWFIIRVWIGLQWVEAGWGKVTSPLWVGPHAGGAIKGFLLGALVKSTGQHPDVQGFYVWWIKSVVMPNMQIFSHVVAFGELLVGIGLILGIFTGIAAFFGSFMNMNYLLAGTVSVNPVLLFFQLLLILAWRTAGWIGIDRWLLPFLGTPWKPGKLFKK